MIIWRISLLASPRTDSSAWMCSSLRKHNRNAAMINDTNHESTYRNVGAAGEAEPCVPDIGIFGHQGGDFQEKQCGVSQLEHLGNGRNSTTQPICVFPLHTHTHTHTHKKKAVYRITATCCWVVPVFVDSQQKVFWTGIWTDRPPWSSSLLPLSSHPHF